MALDAVEVLEKRFASLHRRVSEIEADSRVYRQLFVTFMTNTMPKEMTDAAFSATLDRFSAIARETLIDPEAPPARQEAIAGAIKLIHRDIMAAWAAQRWSPAKRRRKEREEVGEIPLR